MWVFLIAWKFCLFNLILMRACAVAHFDACVISCFDFPQILLWLWRRYLNEPMPTARWTNPRYWYIIRFRRPHGIAHVNGELDEQTTVLYYKKCSRVSFCVMLVVFFFSVCVKTWTAIKDNHPRSRRDVNNFGGVRGGMFFFCVCYVIFIFYSM